MSYTPHEIFQRSTAPVTVDEDKCIADKGCTVCVDVCPLDLLAIDLSKGKAFMKFDECWYCMPCEQDCPTGDLITWRPGSRRTHYLLGVE
jgi:NAD-dependent dihydropyrimidine dehydrogenase PreA subunit